MENSISFIYNKLDDTMGYTIKKKKLKDLSWITLFMSKIIHFSGLTNLTLKIEILSKYDDNLLKWIQHSNFILLFLLLKLFFFKCRWTNGN